MKGTFDLEGLGYRTSCRFGAGRDAAPGADGSPVVVDLDARPFDRALKEEAGHSIWKETPRSRRDRPRPDVNGERLSFG
jgi:hypothetical protein